MIRSARHADIGMSSDSLRKRTAVAQRDAAANGTPCTAGLQPRSATATRCTVSAPATIRARELSAAGRLTALYEVHQQRDPARRTMLMD
jgi:hypothetical protein